VVEIVSSAATQMIISNKDSPVVRAVLDELVERLQETPESAICASESFKHRCPKHLAKTRSPSPTATKKK
jgi:hypothetical protein